MERQFDPFTPEPMSECVGADCTATHLHTVPTDGQSPTAVAIIVIATLVATAAVLVVLLVGIAS